MKYQIEKFTAIQPGLIRVYLSVQEGEYPPVSAEVVIPIIGIFDEIPITPDGQYTQGLIDLGALNKEIQGKMHELRYTIFNALSLTRSIDVINIQHPVHRSR